ncbi:1768_t:CDS:10 [Ambispora gerdemannii]|uniref:Diphthine--ammonia ligase n=1 Tax=Ambispora gerdemannii TaxID=144530 RepID=A0A9N8V1M7_9GLOM|nr:1768_t:CDS:10 [Ambispora gerdemannii]
MKIVALISGGKDSCFNMLHCVANGHEIVALANLKPPDNKGKDEIDSYLYQTVGHDAIQYYAECMNLPLYRREILGDPLVIASDYSSITSGDETEDLYELLKDVKEKHTDIQGVSVGAILSNYQRVRVENVCNRLGLISLAFLWRRDQKELLKEMIETRVDAILIKVAAIGLKPSHLGKSISEMYQHLCYLNEKYDVHVCGEGGEYETFTLNCPLFSKRIVVQETETIVHSDDAYAPVAYLRLKKILLQEEQQEQQQSSLLSSSSSSVETTQQSPSLLNIPSWEKEIGNMVDLLESFDESSPIATDANSFFNFTTHKNAPYFSISGTTAYHDGSVVADDSNTHFVTIEEETRCCMLKLQDRLSEVGLNWSDVVSMNLCITRMSDFSRVNSVYKSFFAVNPPTRACVGANLPPPANVQIDLTAIKSTNDTTLSSSESARQVMHVQSFSYWAPANIGPYSQAIITHNHVYIAGQIGLIPSSLELPSLNNIKEQTNNETDSLLLSYETGLSLRNLEKISSALNEDVRRNTLLCICYVDDEGAFPLVEKAWNVFCGGFDLCRRQRGLEYTGDSDGKEEEGQIAKDDDDVPNTNTAKTTAPVLYVQVPSLPRNAKIEWHALLRSLVTNSKQEKHQYYSDESEPKTNEQTLWQNILTYNNDETTMTTIISITSRFSRPVFSSVFTVRISDNKKTATATTNDSSDYGVSSSSIPIPSIIKNLVSSISDEIHNHQNHQNDYHSNEKESTSQYQPWTKVISVRVFYSEKFIAAGHGVILERVLKRELTNQITKDKRRQDNNNPNYASNLEPNPIPEFNLDAVPAITLIPVLGIMNNSMLGVSLHAVF